MGNLARKLGAALIDALASPEARRYELALARIVAAALAAKLGYDFSAFVS